MNVEHNEYMSPITLRQRLECLLQRQAAVHGLRGVREEREAGPCAWRLLPAGSAVRRELRNLDEHVPG
jgi:hypothetical protein